ncbi:3-carboxyethylcatechol 2,3-dioxygenase [Paraburkholderia sp. MM5384-R2]|uniref:DODA-type extradiol aromatic ring-opening family dioxygenase n=1 Tax=Paraburkholderia sp. MM5384-R2 TaxID=2723097 RepID=UPI001620ACD1|nr:3-carboxyethylcatechol 2,3-dioxygenase [Paraburkholderia sp. MM5384-R2]MBB5498717.1 2,3-dihydroxyphenylpropionate 1,2-dioxygenase [Paraburkholderia sp. MM5384-R2]
MINQENTSQNGQGYLACVPHVPLVTVQGRQANRDFWEVYDERVREFKEFDPELVIVFGGDHYDGIHLNLMPQFVVGQIATALNDCGGYPGRLDIPRDVASAAAAHLVERDFDVATSYAMEVDHGFSNVLHHFLGELDAKPVLPVHINTIADPRPTFRRCRQIGAEIGRFARTLNKRVAFLGSGGLSHQTDFIFPQYDTAPTDVVRDYIVSGGKRGTLSREKWMADIGTGMDKLSGQLLDGSFHASWINEDWDKEFLTALTGGDLTVFDTWTDADVLKAAGYGGSEIRQWIAAVAAAQEFDDRSTLTVDFYSPNTTLAVGVGIVHAR